MFASLCPSKLPALLFRGLWEVHLGRPQGWGPERHVRGLERFESHEARRKTAALGLWDFGTPEAHEKPWGPMGTLERSGDLVLGRILDATKLLQTWSVVQDHQKPVNVRKPRLENIELHSRQDLFIITIFKYNYTVIIKFDYIILQLYMYIFNQFTLVGYSHVHRSPGSAFSIGSRQLGGEHPAAHFALIPSLAALKGTIHRKVQEVRSSEEIGRWIHTLGKS